VFSFQLDVTSVKFRVPPVVTVSAKTCRYATLTAVEGEYAERSNCTSDGFPDATFKLRAGTTPL
jgi:hypothetical protein